MEGSRPSLTLKSIIGLRIVYFRKTKLKSKLKSSKSDNSIVNKTILIKKN